MVANFNRVRMLTPDHSLILESLRDSSVVEMAPDGQLLRAKDTWQQWVLPAQQREGVAKPAQELPAPTQPPSSLQPDIASQPSKQQTQPEAQQGQQEHTTVAQAAAVTAAIHTALQGAAFVDLSAASS